MPRGILILAGLLAGSLLWAYLLVNPIGDGASSSTVSVWQVDLRKVARLIYRNGPTTVTLEPRWQEGRETPFVWVRTESGPAKPAAKRKRGARKSVFKGNSAAEKLLNQFASLEAKRAVGALEGLQAEDFGLSAGEHSLQLELAGQTEPLTLELGGTTYGNLMRYVHAPGDGKVYLFHESRFGRLARARATLFDRELFPVSPVAAKRLKISGAGAEKDLWRLAGERDNQWGDGPDDVEGNPDMAAFVNALKNLKSAAYFAEGAAPELDETDPDMEITLFHAQGGARPAWLRLYRRSESETLAQASFSGGVVKVSRRLAKSVLDKGKKLLGAP
jgi:hypothetical protein